MGVSRPAASTGATVVLAALFWLQSTKTLPGRSVLVIRETTRSGRARSSAARAQRVGEVLGVVDRDRAASTLHALGPDVFGKAVSPSCSARIAQQHGHLATLDDPGRWPGVEVEHDQVGDGLAARGERHCGTCSSSAARLASRTRRRQRLDDHVVDGLAVRSNPAPAVSPSGTHPGCRGPRSSRRRTCRRRRSGSASPSAADRPDAAAAPGRCGSSSRSPRPW